MKRKNPHTAFTLIPPAVKAAQALGLNPDAAALAANLAITKLTGINVLQLLEHPRLAEKNTSFHRFCFRPTMMAKE